MPWTIDVLFYICLFDIIVRFIIIPSFNTLLLTKKIVNAPLIFDLSWLAMHCKTWITKLRLRSIKTIFFYIAVCLAQAHWYVNEQPKIEPYLICMNIDSVYKCSYWKSINWQKKNLFFWSRPAQFLLGGQNQTIFFLHNLTQ